MPSPREPGPGAAQPTESAKDSGHYPVIGSRTRRLHCGIPTALGIDLKEVRVVGDEGSAIVDALNALRLRCTLCLHHSRDRAFDVSIDTDPRTLAILHE